MHSVIVAMPLSYYPLGAQIMTLVLPLGFFIVVMTVAVLRVHHAAHDPRTTAHRSAPGPSRRCPDRAGT